MPHHDWKDQKAICRAVLQGTGDQMFAVHGVSSIDQAIYYRMADEALGTVIRRHSSTKRYFVARVRNPIVLVWGLAGVIAAASLVMAISLWSNVTFGDPATYPFIGGVAAFAAIGVAALGWLISGWITHRTGRSKLTMDVVGARFSQPAFGEAMTAFNKVLRTPRIDSELVARLTRSTDDDDRKAVQGLHYLLNFFEFIAVGVLNGELDQQIVRKTLRGTLNTVYDRSYPYIHERQRQNSRALENMSMLYRHFRDL